MRQKIFILIFVLIIVLSNISFAQEKTSSEIPDQNKEEKNFKWMFYPFLAYTPETKLMGGIAGLTIYRPDGTPKDPSPSDLMVSTIYTQNKQFSISLQPNIYFSGGKYHLSGDIEFMEFPDKFYGIGNDTPEDLEEDYTPWAYKFAPTLSRKVLSHLKLGIGLEITKTELEEMKSGGLMEFYNDRGLAQGLATALGVTIQLDNRDNVFFPTSGCFHQFSVYRFDEAFGGDFNFERYRLDLRRFFNVWRKNVLAFRVYLSANTGELPVTMFPKLGGDEARGYYEGRYRDKTMLSIISEYRVSVWNSFGVVAFAGLTDVAGNVGDLSGKNLKYTFGGGLRFRVNREENVNVRFDYGVTKVGSNFYFGALEVFFPAIVHISK